MIAVWLASQEKKKDPVADDWEVFPATIATEPYDFKNYRWAITGYDNEFYEEDGDRFRTALEQALLMAHLTAPR